MVEREALRRVGNGGVLTLLPALNQQLKTKQDRVDELKKTVDSTKVLLSAFYPALSFHTYLSFQEAESEANRKLEDQTKNMEKLLNKRSVLLQKRDENTRKIRELGSLPTEALSKFRDFTLKELMAKLKEVNVELKDYSSVNKKALDQYLFKSAGGLISQLI